MILIDIPMPSKCAECPCNGNRLYGNCQVKGRWLGGEEGSPMAENRPEWCPLNEMITCKDCRHYDIDFCKKRKHETAPDYSCTAGERKQE